MFIRIFIALMVFAGAASSGTYTGGGTIQLMPTLDGTHPSTYASIYGLAPLVPVASFTAP
jgi:hypothetical protein